VRGPEAHGNGETPRHSPEGTTVMASTSSLRRRSARIAVTVLAGAGVVLAGATAASAAPAPVDINGDGVPDQYQLDTDGDGSVDTWLTDVDNDGSLDEVAVDRDRNLTPDLWIVDADHDTLPDAAYLDSNLDGYPDDLVTGVAYDVVWGPNTAPPAPGAAGSSNPTTVALNNLINETIQRNIDRMTAPACNSSYNGCA
jgi:hypothetical protein